MSAAAEFTASAAKVLGVLPLIGVAVDRLCAQLHALAEAAERVEQASALLQIARDGTVYEAEQPVAPQPPASAAAVLVSTKNAPKRLRSSPAWSAERMALLRAMRGEDGARFPAIAAALNVLPGPVITIKAAQMRAHHFGIVAPLAGARAKISVPGPKPKDAPQKNAPVAPPAETATPAEEKAGWTAARKATLRALWAEGLSCETIAERLRISKNAAVGKAHRMGLAARPSPIKPPAPPAAELLRGKTTLAPLGSEMPRAIPRMPDAEHAPPPKAIVADIDQIRSFLERKGPLPEPFDIAAANAICRRIGAPEFVLGVRASMDVATAWAQRENLGFPAPLFAINAERMRRGAPLFIVPGVAP